MRQNSSPAFQARINRRRKTVRSLAVMLASVTCLHAVQAAATPCIAPALQTIAPAAGNYSARISYSKSEAILQGSASRLELIRRQQAGGALAAASPIPDHARPAVATIVFRPQTFTLKNPLFDNRAPTELNMGALTTARFAPTAGQLPLPSFLASFAPTLPFAQAVPVLPEKLSLVTETRSQDNMFCNSVPLPPQPAFASGAAQPIRPGSPDIFGSVAISVSHTSLDNKWRQVAQGSLGSRAGPWSGLLAQNRDRDRRTQIANVNAWVNARISFVDDVRQYGTADYWAPGAQSLARGRGDCEDYAIAKMQMLRALGVPANSMYLVIARDLVRHADHAILAVAMDGDLLILDNETDRILRSAEVSDYRPILSFNGTKSWTHGYRTQPQAAPIQMASLMR